MTPGYVLGCPVSVPLTLGMDDGPLDFTFTPYDYQDNTWYINRELGQPDDPYNLNCKKIPKEDPKYSEYIGIGQQLCDQLEKDILTNEDDGWVLVQDKDVWFFSKEM